MSYYDEEFYNEPSEFEQEIDGFKQAIMQAVKDDHVREVEELRKENAELQEVKRNFTAIQREYQQKAQQLEYDRQKVRSEVRRERLDDLMKDFEVIMYRVDSSYVLPPKCEKCNEKRHLSYKTPRGKDAFEDCECKNSLTVFVPEEFICKEFKADRDGKKIVAWYRPSQYTEDGYVNTSSTFCTVVYHDGLDFEKITRYETFFKTKEECQQYCDWLNLQPPNRPNNPQAVKRPKEDAM